MKISKSDAMDVMRTLAYWADLQFRQPESGSALHKVIQALRETPAHERELQLAGLTDAEAQAIREAMPGGQGEVGPQGEEEIVEIDELPRGRRHFSSMLGNS